MREAQRRGGAVRAGCITYTALDASASQDCSQLPEGRFGNASQLMPTPSAFPALPPPPPPSFRGGVSSAAGAAGAGGGATSFAGIAAGMAADADAAAAHKADARSVLPNRMTTYGDAKSATPPPATSQEAVAALAALAAPAAPAAAAVTEAVTEAAAPMEVAAVMEVAAEADGCVPMAECGALL